MSNEVHWVVETAIKDGQLEAFKTLSAEMVASAKAEEPDTLHYEWFISADGTSCHIYERYRDSAATMKHLKWFADNYLERFRACADTTHISLYGNPDEQVQAAMAKAKAVYRAPLEGFKR